MPRTPLRSLAAPNRSLRRTFFIIAAVIATWHAYTIAIDPSLRVVGSALISAAALLPAYMWCRGALSGIPIVPAYGLTFILKYGYALAGDDPIITVYGETAGFQAGLLVAVFLLLLTLAAFGIQKVVRAPRGPVRAMPPGRGDSMIVTLIFLASIYLVGQVGQWYSTVGGIHSIIRSALTGLASVGIFVLAYRWAAGELDGFTKRLFAFGLALYMVANSMSLFMVEMMAAAALAVFAYVIGGGRVPWKWLLAMFGLFVVLHAGKGEMRTEYWWSNYKAVQIYDYPWFLAEWLGYGWEALKAAPQDDDDSGSFSERMTLVPLLMKVQAETPEKRPYLLGETYAHLPALLVPRVLYPDKPYAHKGSHLLSVYYGLQTPEATERSTIAWGLLTESYANFGIAGVVVLALALGAIYGGVAKMASEVPLLSLRTLIAIVFTAVALQSDGTLAIHVSTLFQTLIVVFAMSLVVMEPELARPALLTSRARAHPAPRAVR